MPYNSDHHKIIQNFFQKNSRLPSYSEMEKLFGYKSKNSVHRIVTKMIEEGILAKDRAGKIIAQNLIQTVRILGSIQAGFPSAAEEETCDTMTLDDFMIANKEATYLLRVQGDSMRDAGILEGDMVLAEKTDRHRPGDIVIAEIDGAWTLKYLRKTKDGTLYLQPANPDYEDIYPKHQFQVAAVVRGVLRKYRS